MLIGAGIQMKYISLNGQLTYPLEENFEYMRSDDYNSRWAQPTS